MHILINLITYLSKKQVSRALKSPKREERSRLCPDIGEQKARLRFVSWTLDSYIVVVVVHARWTVVNSP